MEGGRERSRPPVDGEPARVASVSRNDGEQAIVGTHVPALVGAERDRRPIAADAGIDHADEDRTRRKRRRDRREQIGCGLRVARRQVVREVDNWHARRLAR